MSALSRVLVSVWGWAAIFLLPTKDWVGESGLQAFEAAELADALKAAVEAADP